MQPGSTKTRNKRGRASVTDIDRQLGPKIRERRILLGLSQQQLADLIGVSFQQLAKYEIGINRVFTGQLYAIAQALGVEVAYFFPSQGEQQFLLANKPQRRLLELARNVVAITNPRHKQLVCDHARRLAGDVPTEELNLVEMDPGRDLSRV